MSRAVREAVRRLESAGVPSPCFDAEELLAHVLGVPRVELRGRCELPGPTLRRYAELIDQRAARVPLQHLTGHAGFRYLDLQVGPGVFVPRPETELLAGWAICRLRDAQRPRVADLCAGAGGIALSVAHELPGALVYAVELDPAALAWADRNVLARAAAGDPPVTLVSGDATDPEILRECDGRLHAVLSNPPYVPDDGVVEPEVAEHDPPLALYGGPDGLAVVRRLVDRAAHLLLPGGLLALEHADVQGEAVPALILRQGAFTDVEDHTDLNGRPRFTTASRR